MQAAFKAPGQALAERGLRARKGLSQNFLRDEQLADEIIAQLPGEPRALGEIGAGTGVMTRKLAETRRVAAVEIDESLAGMLSRQFARDEPVTVVAGDALELDLGRLLPAPYAVFGNIPYHITGALIPRLLTLRPAPEWVCLLVQLEVAERLCAAPGGWSLATLAARAYADAELLLRVPAHAFVPEPKVDSGLVILRPHDSAAFAEPAFFDFARLVFQERRKKLSNAVANALGHDVAAGRQLVGAAGIDEMRRPQTLDLTEWGRLYQAYRGLTR
jgi:16S rRNA (adenine1518-N6/adenine1519-N6)-dimethyltransferase